MSVMSNRYTDEFRADGVRIARIRGSGVTLGQTQRLTSSLYVA